MKKVQQFKKVTEWIAKMAMLNLIWLLLSLPIITIIPATDALFEVLAKDISDDQDFRLLYSLFLNAFKMNFKQSYIFATPILCVCSLLFFDVSVLKMISLSTTWLFVYKAMLYIATLIIILTILMGYSLAKRMKANYFRIYFIALKLVVNHPIVTMALTSSLFFLNVLILRWPTLSYFFSMSVTCWLATQAIVLIDRKTAITSVNRKL